MAYCENCGRELSDQAVACPNCGHPRTAAGRVDVGTATGYAEWWQRAIAYIIDGFIVAVPAIIIMFVAGIGLAASSTKVDEFGNLRANSVGIAGFFLSIALIFIVGILYRVLLEGGARGQTVGKMAMKIAVKDANNGGSIGYGRAFVRWLVASVLWFAFYLPGIIDLLFPLWDAKKQTIHDKAASSVVVLVQ